MCGIRKGFSGRILDEVTKYTFATLNLCIVVACKENNISNKMTVLVIFLSIHQRRHLLFKSKLTIVRPPRKVIKVIS